MSTTIQRQTIELLTPALLAGAHQERPEWRGASLHGQLHFWARVLAYDGGDASKMRMGEARLIGGFVKEGGKLVPQAGPFAVWLEGEAESDPDEYPGCPHDHYKGWRKGLSAKSTADLCWSRRRIAAWSKDDAASNAKLDQDFAWLLRTWILLGALGLRANRAAGSVWIPGWPPTPEEFKQQIEKLSLPACIEVRLLPHVVAPDLKAWVNRRRQAEREDLSRQGEAEQLRAIATDTVGGHIEGDPLGYAGNGRERKASQLKLKVGRFSDGMRLIAVFDQRPGRDGKLVDAIGALEAAGKQLGTLLHMATVVSAPPVATAPGRASSPASEVAAILAGRFEYPKDFERYRKQVAAWTAAGCLDCVAEFVRLTQHPKYAGLRSQPWYQEATAHSAPGQAAIDRQICHDP